MMNENHSDYEQLERLMKRAHMPEPLDQLKQRITAEAGEVWQQTATEVPWQVPVKRLLGSAAAAVLIISLSNILYDHAPSRFSSGTQSDSIQRLADLDARPEMPHSPLVKRLVSSERSSPVSDVTAWRNYLETMRQVLGEPEQHGSSLPASSSGGSSCLFPERSGTNVHS